MREKIASNPLIQDFTREMEGFFDLLDVTAEHIERVRHAFIIHPPEQVADEH